jgi:nitric oxide dioxygenase
VAEALSDKTIEIVKSTVPALEAGGTAITDRMYQLMFRNAEVRALFNQSHHGETGSQSKALTAAIIAYARNIDNLVGAGLPNRAHHPETLRAQHPARALSLRG